MFKVQRYLSAALVAVGLLTTTSACAAQVYTRRGDYSRNERRLVYENGYRDGLVAGRRDARNRERYDPTRSREYRAAGRGWDRRFGVRDDYRWEYRTAFEHGYDAGFREGRRR